MERVRVVILGDPVKTRIWLFHDAMKTKFTVHEVMFGVILHEKYPSWRINYQNNREIVSQYFRIMVLSCFWLVCFCYLSSSVLLKTAFRVASLVIFNVLVYTWLNELTEKRNGFVNSQTLDGRKPLWKMFKILKWSLNCLKRFSQILWQHSFHTTDWY